MIHTAIKLTRLMCDAWIVGFAIWMALPGGATGADLPLPPPPSLVPPTVDLSQIAALRIATPQGTSANVELQQLLTSVREEAGRRSTIKSELFDQLRRALPEGSDGHVFEKVNIPDDLELPEAGWDVRFQFRLPTRGIGSAPYSALVTDSDGAIWNRFSGSVWIDREAGGVQVTRVVRRGETIGANDVSLLGTRLSELPRGAFDGETFVVGTTAQRELRPGQWLTEQMVKTPLTVRRGQVVTMCLKRGPLSITAPGIVQQNGARGQVVRVQNAGSQREIFARVISKDEVQVVY